MRSAQVCVSCVDLLPTKKYNLLNLLTGIPWQDLPVGWGCTPRCQAVDNNNNPRCPMTDDGSIATELCRGVQNSQSCAPARLRAHSSALVACARDGHQFIAAAAAGQVHTPPAQQHSSAPRRVPARKSQHLRGVMFAKGRALCDTSLLCDWVLAIGSVGHPNGTRCGTAVEQLPLPDRD